MSQFVNTSKSGLLGLITTPDGFGILVSAGNTDLLVWSEPTVWAVVATKISSAFSNQTKN